MRAATMTPVMLTGHITRRTAYKDLYNLSDSTATVFIKINRKNWPRNLTVDDKTKVEIVGKFDREFVGFDKIKVIDIRPAN
ncbi:NirD/YgiW/YdeI family stress tolerance protein [Uliginosibacterium sp. sgz301328]|uniref:NirD/YgiW/YdeI family stress tolerance protein n=1 Tax=Uliginosibacterium sp. sgz301328 TaxID=3243764 RepID=UPI00359E6D38